MKVAVLEQYALSSLARLKAAGIEIVPAAEQADILLIRSKTKIDKAFLDRAKDLKLIVTATSGFDHIDWRECQKRGVIVAQTPNANAQSTAELAVGLMIMAERFLLEAVKGVRANKWREGLRRPHGLEGKTLGIIGLGRVGSRVARIASALGMKLQAHDPYIEPERFTEFSCERAGLIELFRTSDIVTLHVPLTKETKHLLNNPTFAEMQAEALLVNTCRGPVVDENDLLKALDEGTIAGAAMDVIEREPPPAGHRLLQHPRLILTPHIGAYTESAWEKASQEAVDKVLQFKSGEKLTDTLPLPTPWFEKT